MRTIIGALCSVPLLGYATVGHSATYNYYYVSGPALIANQARVEDRPLMNVGVLTIDTSGLQQGETLAGRTIGYSYNRDEYEGHDGIELSVDFSLGTGSEELAYRFTFDEQENITRWNVAADWIHTFSEMELFRVSNAESRYHRFVDGAFSYSTHVATEHLAKLGYDQRNPAYQALFCGSWAGPGADCGEDGSAAFEWAQHFAAAGGTWIKDDLAAFAALMQSTTIEALNNPPRSYHDIQAVPLPAPAGLLVVGGLSLAWIGRRRRGKAAA